MTSVKWCAEAGNRVCLVGAGISVDPPSAIPAAMTLMDVMFRWIAADEKAVVDALWARASIVEPNPFAALRFEAIVQAITNVVAPPLDFLKQVQTFGAPNPTHRYLAREIGRGATVVTVNFDDRIEAACLADGIDPRRYVVSSSRRRPPDNAGLLKLHGTFVRKGASVPWATLGKIGGAGLGFDRYPSLCEWIAKKCGDAHLVVAGYSASDHFDVVPLFERCAAPRRVSWMDYVPRGDAVITPFLERDGCPIPRDPRSDHTTFFLSSIAARSPQTMIERVTAPNVSRFIGALGRNEESPEGPLDQQAVEEASRYREQNIVLLREALNGLTVSDRDRRDLLSILLEEDAFGGHLDQNFVRPNEDVESEDRIFALGEELIASLGLEKAATELERMDVSTANDPTADRNRIAGIMAAEMRMGEVGKSFASGIRLVEASATAGMPLYRQLEMLQMHCEDHFDLAISRGLTDVGYAIIRHLEELFTETGHIIAGVQSRLFRARILMKFAIGDDSRRVRLSALKRGYREATAAAYHSLRSGRADVATSAVLLSASFLDLGSNPLGACDILVRFHSWMDATDIRRADVLMNLGVMAARCGEVNLARWGNNSLLDRRIRGAEQAKAWQYVVAANIAAAEGNTADLRRNIRKAEEAGAALEAPYANALEDQLVPLRRKLRGK